MNNEIITLDGKNNGFAIYCLATESYVTNKNGVILFRNIDLARIYAANVKHMHNPYDYDLYIGIQGSMIHYDYFEKVDGLYQFYATCDDVETKYYIKPYDTRAVKKVGYIVVNNGEREFDKVKGFAKTNLYYDEALKAINVLVKKACLDPNICSIGRDKYGLVANIKNSTAKIHICHNSHIMTINQQRKVDNQIAFRFDKSMDKFTTLYTFIDIDISEPKWFEGIEKAVSILKTISQMMVNSCEDINACEYREIELNVPIILTDNYVAKRKS